MRLIAAATGLIVLNATFLYVTGYAPALTPIFTALPYMVIGLLALTASIFLISRIMRAKTPTPPFNMPHSPLQPDHHPDNPSPLFTKPSDQNTPTPIQATIEPPDEYTCSLSYHLMKNPVETPTSSQRYERKRIEEWIDKSTHELVLMECLPPNGKPEPGKLYIGTDDYGNLNYIVAKQNTNKSVTAIKGELNICIKTTLTSKVLTKHRAEILAVTSQKKHTYGSDPINREPLTKADLKPLPALRTEIQNWRLAHPEFKEQSDNEPENESNKYTPRYK